MLSLTLDAFSGRPNPTWLLPTPAAGRVLDIFRDETPGAVAVADAFAPLGYRGLHLDVLDPGLALARRMPRRMFFSPFGGSISHAPRAIEALAIAAAHGVARAIDRAMEFVREIVRWIIEACRRALATPPPPRTLPPGQRRWPCAHETQPYDPHFWNDPAHILQNNCYAYAANRREDLFPQPGRGAGRPMLRYDELLTGPVTAATMADGARRFDDCLPASEAPRLLVALVVAPGIDYHWYREHGAFWGHKPGPTAARDFDEAHALILDPQVCDRGPYSDFCGYFLLPRGLRLAGA
jgi:hypothetical protein